MTKSALKLARTLSCIALLALSTCQQQTPVQSPPPSEPPGGPPAPLPPVTREIELTLGKYLQECPHVLIRFPYNESQPLPQDNQGLEALAACLNSSPYQSVRVRLIGRTDSEGSEAYNEKLGLQRAEYVKNALVRYGVDAGRIEAESAGAAGATAAEGESAPGYDRRVDVVQLVVITPI